MTPLCVHVKNALNKSNTYLGTATTSASYSNDREEQRLLVQEHEPIEERSIQNAVRPATFIMPDGPAFTQLPRTALTVDDILVVFAQASPEE